MSLWFSGGGGRWLSLAFRCTWKCTQEQIWTLGWVFMQCNTNVHARQVLCRATEPWTVKMSAPINNSAASSLPDRNVCTCIFRWSAWKVYLCHMVGKFCLFFLCTRPFTAVAWEGSASHRFNKPLSVCIRFKATKPQGSRAAAACGAQQWLQIWSHRTRRREGVSLMEKREKRSGVDAGSEVVICSSSLNMIKYYNTKEYF